MRKTKQKELINDTVKTMKHFFTAEELFEQVRKEEPNIGIATIYRFLKDNNTLHHYMCNRRHVYSKNKDVHAHFTCEKCNEMTHFEIDNIDEVNNHADGEVCHILIDVHGVCNKCKTQS